MSLFDILLAIFVGGFSGVIGSLLERKLYVFYKFRKYRRFRSKPIIMDEMSFVFGEHDAGRKAADDFFKSRRVNKQ